jgi:hypothetical protein
MVGTIKQVPNHTEVIVKLDNGQIESINNEYIQLELDSSIDALANPNLLGQELLSPGIATARFV